MTQLVVHSARISYGGPDRLDVTRKSGTDGLFLAPSWALLQPVLKARKQVRDWIARGLHPGDELERRTWATYVEGYLAEMRVSYSSCGACDGADPNEDDPDYQHTCDRNQGPRPPPHRPGHFRFNLATAAAWHRGARSNNIRWLKLFASPRVVLVCYCMDPEHCHRFLLRTRILPALGAVDGGELLQEAA